MKKCDLHIHTVCTVSDPAFTFNMDVMKDYVKKMKLDVIAITNHNTFDMANYMAIREEVAPTVVLPGIEVDLEGGHILVITSPDDGELYDFNNRCETVTRRITDATTSISLEEFQSIFTDLSKYVLIPHYDKTPQLPKPIIESLSEFIFAGEVGSVKKFLYMQKDHDERLTPVLFSDFRSAEGIGEEKYPVRQTFLDLNEVSISALNICLRDKAKATLSENDGNKLFNVFSDGQMISTGLNIMYGRRSTGKTWTMDRLSNLFGDRAKYIKQFELQNYGQAYTSEQFESDQRVRLESEVNYFFSPFKNIVDDISQIPSLASDNSEVDYYLTSLKKRSEMENINDVYSNSKIFDEIPYSVERTTQLRKVITSVINLLEADNYKEILNKYIGKEALTSLLKELIEKLYYIELRIKCKVLTNNILSDVKAALQTQTALPPIPDIDLYEIARHQLKRKKFIEIVKAIKRERVIYDENVQKFRIVVKTKLYRNATDVKEGQGISASLASAYENYSNPLVYLQKLIDAGIDSSKLHKLFVGIQYKILNENGFPVSGGERSEFLFLQKIRDARSKDILLIDEPESSFDNVFLKNEINKFIKDIAAEMPVVISTHNNTIGGSIKPDYILYTEKDMNGEDVKFRLYSGFASDPLLRTVDGEGTENYQITIDSLEAGENAYKERGRMYGILKNK